MKEEISLYEELCDYREKTREYRKKADEMESKLLENIKRKIEEVMPYSFRVRGDLNIIFLDFYKEEKHRRRYSPREELPVDLTYNDMNKLLDLFPEATIFMPQRQEDCTIVKIENIDFNKW